MKTRHAVLALVCGAAVLSTGVPAEGQVAFFVVAEDEPFPWWLKSRDLSADGRVLVGELSTPARTAFRWTADGGLRFLEPVAAGTGEIPLSRATSVSADGSTIVGMAADGRLFRWVEGEGTTLHEIGPDAGYHIANAYVSDNGEIVAGNVEIGDLLFNFWWTVSGSSEVLPYYIRSGNRRATALSGNGQVVVGYAGSSEVPWVWPRRGNYRTLPTGGMPRGRAYAVSVDGSVIVGEVRGASEWHAVRWTAPLYGWNCCPYRPKGRLVRPSRAQPMAQQSSGGR